MRHGLLARGLSVAEAALLLSRQFTLSRRQAYRYIEAAQTIERPVPVAEPTIAGDVQASAQFGRCGAGAGGQRTRQSATWSAGRCAPSSAKPAAMADRCGAKDPTSTSSMRLTVSSPSSWSRSTGSLVPEAGPCRRHWTADKGGGAMKTAAIYARVSSDQQKEENTIASQTAALMEFAASEGYSVPAEWMFEDEGFSGASLVRPGLERLRDLAAEGQIQAVLVYSPDRLSRKYAYQVLLTEEFARHGVRAMFIKAPQVGHAGRSAAAAVPGHDRRVRAGPDSGALTTRQASPRQSMARSACLSGAPYGYRYVRKSDERPALLRGDRGRGGRGAAVYELYTVDGLEHRRDHPAVNELGVPTQEAQTLGTFDGVGDAAQSGLPGTACFGKTQTGARQRCNSRAVTPARAACLARNSAAARSAARPMDRDCRVPPWWIERHLRVWRRSAWPTTSSPLAAPSSRASCKAWFIAANAATLCIAPRRVAARARSTTTAAWVRMPGAIWAGPLRRSARSARICSITSCGGGRAMLEDPA